MCTLCNELYNTVLGIPRAILLTHIDKLEEKECTDVKSVFKNIKIKDAVFKTASIFGIPENQIHPVKCYKQEMGLSQDVNILALLALRQMLHWAEDHLDNAQMREAVSAMRLRGTDDVEGRRAREDETSSEAI